MRRWLVVFAVTAWVLSAGAALAGEAGSDASSSAGGGKATAARSSQSAKITISGPASVGVAQGSVSGDSTGRGSDSGSTGGGSSAAGPPQAEAAAPVASEDGVVEQVSLPALELGESQSASDSGPDVVTWAIAALIVIGLVVLYRRLPRPART